jgi:hypothetical protein
VVYVLANKFFLPHICQFSIIPIPLMVCSLLSFSLRTNPTTLPSPPPWPSLLPLFFSRMGPRGLLILPLPIAPSSFSLLASQVNLFQIQSSPFNYMGGGPYLLTPYHLVCFPLPNIRILCYEATVTNIAKPTIESSVMPFSKIMSPTHILRNPTITSFIARDASSSHKVDMSCVHPLAILPNPIGANTIFPYHSSLPIDLDPKSMITHTTTLYDVPGKPPPLVTLPPHLHAMFFLHRYLMGNLGD